MGNERLVKEEPKINASNVAYLFGNLVSTSPIWLDSNCGIVSVNTQARRLGCMIYLIGLLVKGHKIETLLLSPPPQEILALKDNIIKNGFTSGFLTGKSSSIRHYIDAVSSFHLIFRQGAMLNPTGFGQFLIQVLCPKYTLPYPLPYEARFFFLYKLLKYDFFGIAAIVSALLEGHCKISDIQRIHQAQLLHLLENVSLASTNARLKRLAQDRITSLRAWRNPNSYSEHLVPAKLNWLADLGVFVENQFSPFQIKIKSEHEHWLNDFIRITVPTEPDLLALVLNYAMAIIPKEEQPLNDELCVALCSAFSKFTRSGNFMKIRSIELVIFLLCFHIPMLIRLIKEGNRLMTTSAIECYDATYKVHMASRSTQSYILCERKSGD
jgi:hypothetical protein